MTKLLCLALLTSGCYRSGFVAVEIGPHAPLELAAFAHLQLHAYGLRADGSREDITDLVRWRSTNPEVAAIGDVGTLEWAAAGTTEVRVVFYDLAASATLTTADPVAALR